MIVVTGASRGLGRAICERLDELDIPICGLARNTAGLPFNSYACDVSSFEEVKSVSKLLKKQKTTITGLINAAGIASMNLALTTPESVTRKIIETNLLGTIFCCQLLSPLLIRNQGGTIINFSTIAVPIGLKGESVYVASKAGVEGFSKSFAREMSDFNINVNCIAPGPIDTDLIKSVSKKLIDNVIQKQVIPKKFNTGDICNLVEMLIDDKSKSLSGQVFYVGGI
jgi:3-oxoacyl-[acyl-carrier protein] reductase